jgi:hypothetical protein
MCIHCSSTCIWSISFSVDTVYTLQQHLYMEYIFTCGYIAAAPVYGVYLSQLIRWIHCTAPVYGVYLSQLIRWIHCCRTCIWSISFSVDTVDTLQQHLYMEYIFLSWYGIPVVVVPIMIFLTEVFLLEWSY